MSNHDQKSQIRDPLHLQYQTYADIYNDDDDDDENDDEIIVVSSTQRRWEKLHGIHNNPQNTKHEKSITSDWEVHDDDQNNNNNNNNDDDDDMIVLLTKKPIYKKQHNNNHQGFGWGRIQLRSRFEFELYFLPIQQGLIMIAAVLLILF